MSSGAASPSFDWSRISLGTRIAGLGALVLVLAVFMSWVHVTVGDRSSGVSGWSAFALAKLAFLAAAVAIAVLVLEQVRPDVTLPLAPSLILAACGAVALLSTLYHLLFVPSAGAFAEAVGVSVGRSPGVVVATLAAGALAYGGWRRMQEA
jgi:hypothetical protein